MENKTTTTAELTVNRTYKSTVFTMLYADKGNLLDLYNAMAGTHYTDPELLEINTLENRPVKLDLEVTILNIAGENNRELKATCRTLREYAIYTDKIRQYTEEMSLEEAVDRAIRECISEDVLREFLENHRMEARAMSIFEYDQEKHMRQEREAAWKEGRRAGLEEGRRSGLEEGREQILESLIRKKLAKGKTVSEIAGELEETEEHIKALISKMEV